MTPLQEQAQEIVQYYRNGTLGSFSTALFELFMKADLHNQRKLGETFPEYLLAYQLWFEGVE